ncbi:MAG: hypothetical protein IT310_13780 [Anaerolineales bacterium]|nr:hypothetical protein [Anaerolineales bacterium]
MLLQILQGIGYLSLLIVLVAFWRQALLRREPRAFWTLFAWAWTMNLLGNLAWVLHDAMTGTALATFSFVDVFYILRYALVALALWLYPTPLTQKFWKWVGLAAGMTGALVWAFYFRPAMDLNGGDWISFLGLALYPVLDAGLIAIAWLRVRASRETSWSQPAVILFLAVMSYGLANTLNLTEYVFPPLSSGVLPNLFWILTDVGLIVLVIIVNLKAQDRLNKEV